MAKTSQLPAARSPAPVLQLVPAPFQAKRPRPYTPRPYQQRCIAALAEARAQGETSALVVMASGLGKTPTLIFDLEQYLTEFPDARVLFLCDQETILVQSKAKFRKYFGEEYSYGLYSGSHKTLHRVNFMFATLQSVRDHPEDFPVDAYDYIAVDEAHHSSADTYAPTIQRFQYRFLLGLTATPDREDGRNILDIYGRVVFEMDVFDGWAEGYLAPTDYRLMLDDFDERELQKCLDPEYSGMKISMAQLNRTIFAPKRDDEIVAAIREQTADLENPRIFVFRNNIQHAETMAEHFGGEAAVVHSGQSSSLNFAILSAFQAGQINIVISVNMLNEGVDVPEADCVVFLRVTDVKRIFFQQLGRGLRLSTGKRVVRVLDFVSAIERIVMILEMEETAKQRIKPESSSYPFSAKRLPPITVNVRATKFKAKRVDLEQLLNRIRYNRIWSREEMIQSLQMHAKDGYMPTCEYIQAHSGSMPPINQIFSEFQTMGKAAEVCCLKPNRTQLTEDEIVYQYHICCRDQKRWLTAAEFARITGISIHAHTSGKAIGGITNLREEALKRYGSFETAPLSDNEKAWNQDYSLNDIREAIQNLTRRLRRAPGKTDIEKDPLCPDYSTCRKRLGGGIDVIQRECQVDEILQEMGISRSRCGLTDAEKTTFQDFVRRNQRRIKRRDLGKGILKNCPGEYIIHTYIGGMDDLNELIGADDLIQDVPPLNPETMAWLQGIVRKEKRPLKSRDFPNRNEGFMLSYDKVKRTLHAQSIGEINQYVGADQILAELATENN